MHVYIYDSFLSHNKYNNVLAKIETRITDLGLNGKISRLGVMKNFRDTVQGEIKRGAKTIIAVGNDQTVSEVVNAMGGSEVPMGIIPIGKEKNLVAASLGIEPELPACDVLSARRIEKVDLGKANNLFFLSRATITTVDTVIEIDRDYSIEVMEHGEINIINLPLDKSKLPGNGQFNPQDGTLELYIETGSAKKFLKKTVSQSVFPFKRLTIENKRYPIILDNSASVAAPVEISIAVKNLNVIVGKNRNF